MIGLIEDGERCLSCRNHKYVIGRGDIVLFNPGDNHSCARNYDGGFAYRGINIAKEVMADLAEEITGKKQLPGFSKNVIDDPEAVCYLRALHEKVMRGYDEFGKEEMFILLISILMRKYGQPFERCIPECPHEIEKACNFIEEHYKEHIYLDQICRHAGLSKSTLLRAFAKSKGVTPYIYLENIRIGNARKLLENGLSPTDAALQSGFSDQSHFTNYFNRFFGLTPGAYRKIFTARRPEPLRTEKTVRMVKCNGQ